MTIDEKREALEDFCDEQVECRFCLLSNERGDCAFDDFDLISEENVETAYELAFGGKQNVRREEINHPDRYNSGGFECIDVMLAVFGKEVVQNFCILNSFKYIWRHKQKGGTEDIKKAVWYLNKFVGLEELPDD